MEVNYFNKFTPDMLSRGPDRSRLCLSRMKSSLYPRYKGNAFRSSPTGTTSSWMERLESVSSEIQEKDFICSGRSNLSTVKMEDGIGITRFLSGKRLFITGATGFLGKVLLEKILRTMPDVDKIYVIIHAKTNEAAKERLVNEIINSEFFVCLRQTHGKSYVAFMTSKLVPVAGNISSPNLGIQENLLDSITKEVDIIINSAANTVFDDRYDTSVATNTKGPYHLMNIANRCSQLKVFLHISTAYVSGKRVGVIKETPFRIDDDTIVREMLLNSGEKMPASIPTLDVESEIRLAADCQRNLGEHDLADRKLKELGKERANENGWQNAYSFTKTMGEMMIDKMRGNFPVVIIRPTTVESTQKEPFPGWIQGIRMMDPFILSYGRGLVTGLPIDPTAIIDVIPADMVINATLTAIAKHGTAREPEIIVYHTGSSVPNPLSYGEFLTFLHEYFSNSPILDSQGKPILVSPMKLFRSMDEFLDYLRSDMPVPERKFDLAQRKAFERTHKNLADAYLPYLFYHGRYDISNTERMMESMSDDEKRTFGFDVRSIDWKDYFLNVHIPGLRRCAFKGKKLV